MTTRKLTRIPLTVVVMMMAILVVPDAARDCTYYSAAFMENQP